MLLLSQRKAGTFSSAVVGNYFTNLDILTVFLFLYFFTCICMWIQFALEVFCIVLQILGDEDN